MQSYHATLPGSYSEVRKTSEKSGNAVSTEPYTCTGTRKASEVTADRVTLTLVDISTTKLSRCNYPMPNKRSLHHSPLRTAIQHLSTA